MSDKEILEVRPTTSEKIGNWIKSNFITIILVIVSILYLARGLGEIVKTGKTVLQIITDGAISFTFGFLYVSLMGEQGIMKARGSFKYRKTMEVYGKVIDEITPIADKLDAFCDYENEQALKKAQTQILYKEGLTYKRFINGEYDAGINPTTNKPLDDDQLLAIKEARKAEPFKLTRDLLVSEHSNNEGFANLESGLGKYRKKQLTKRAITKIITAVLFSYYTFKRFETIDIGAIIWYGLQIIIFLLFGFLEQQKNYEYVNEVERSKIIRKIDLLYVFINIVKNTPELLTPKESEEDGGNQHNELEAVCTQ